MKRFAEDIDNLCAKYSDLGEDDIALIRRTAKKLPALADEKQRDIFINITARTGKETVTVALARCDDTVYNINTLGFTIRDEDEPAVLRTLQYGIPSKDMWAISYTTTEGNRIVQDAYPIENDGRVIAVVVEERRLTLLEIEEWKREDCWIPSDYQTYPYLRYLDWLGDCLDHAVIVTNSANIVVYRNYCAKILYHEYGYIYDIHGKDYNSVSMHGPLHVLPCLECSSRTDEIYSGGHYYHVKQYCMRDEDWFCVVIISDITKEREKDENLVLKSVALREAHHRIKNNLQTIYNLLDMQKRRTDSEECAQALSETMGRIMSISASYEQLLISGLDESNVKEVLEDFREKFLIIIRDDRKRISVTVSGDDVYVKSSIVTDISIVVNELVQNAYKHAFAGRESGSISITIQKRTLYAMITVTDDGIGIPPAERTSGRSGGMGFQIVRSITESKLRGQFHCESGARGTTVSFSFKHEKDA